MLFLVYCGDDGPGNVDRDGGDASRPEAAWVAEGDFGRLDDGIRPYADISKGS